MSAEAAGVSAPAAGSIFSLGWLMSQLFGPLQHRRATSPSDHLPTISELDEDDQMALALVELDDLLKPYARDLSSEGIKKAWKSPAHRGFQPAVLALHLQILERLVLDYEQLKAYQLGRALSDTCWLPDKATGAEFFLEQFNRYRLATLQRWLAEAGGAIPALSRATVSRSLQNWQDWADTNAVRLKKGNEWTTAHWSVVDALHTQGSAWHALLAGEADASDQTSADAWVQAGESLVRTARLLTAAILRRFWPVVVIVVAATGGLLYLAIANSHGTAKLWTSLVTVATTLGVSGAGLRSAGAKVADGIKDDVWSAARLDAQAWAVTWLPAMPQKLRQRRRLASLGVATAQSGTALEKSPAQQEADREAADKREAERKEAPRIAAARRRAAQQRAAELGAAPLAGAPLEEQPS